MNIFASVQIVINRLEWIKISNICNALTSQQHITLTTNSFFFSFVNAFLKAYIMKISHQKSVYQHHFNLQTHCLVLRQDGRQKHGSECGLSSVLRACWKKTQFCGYTHDVPSPYLLSRNPSKARTCFILVSFSVRRRDGMVDKFLLLSQSGFSTKHCHLLLLSHYIRYKTTLTNYKIPKPKRSDQSSNNSQSRYSDEINISVR